MTFRMIQASGRNERIGRLPSDAVLPDSPAAAGYRSQFFSPADHPVPRPTPEPVDSRRAPARHAAGLHTRRKHWSTSPAGVVWLAIGFGFCVDGLAVTISSRNNGIGLALFWVAVLAPYAILLAVLAVAEVSRLMREFAVAAIGVYPAIICLLGSPLVPGGYDAHLHERTLVDLLHGSGLFAPNPLLPVSPYYPGMELSAGTVIRLTGMPLMLGMSLMVLLCRLALVMTIYRAALTVCPSRRAASLVVVLYAASPQFFYFDSQFAYETMALTLGLGGLFLLRRAQLSHGAAARRISLLAILALIATVVTHHITSWMVLGFLVAWTVVTPRSGRSVLTRAAVVMAISAIIWTATLAARLKGYLGPVFAGALQESESFLGGAGQRRLFSDPAGSVTPQWQRVSLIFYALLCACAALICGWKLLGATFRNRNARLGLLGALSLSYPVTLAAHYVPAASELGDRASTFLFFPLALSCSLVAFRDLGAVKPAARQRGPAFMVAFIGLTSIIYLGGVLLGSGPDWERLPGPYLVSAEARTQDPQTLAAVRWAAAHLPAGSRIVADRIPAALLASEAQLWPLYFPERGLEWAWLYFPETWGISQTTIVRMLHIRYLYVDKRLADSLPHEGNYFYEGESPQPRHIPITALTKFSHVRGLITVYHQGPVTIYDTSGLWVVQEPDGFVNERPMGLGALGDSLWGIEAVLLFLTFRRRLEWVISTARSVGVLGSGVAILALSVPVGGVLLGLRLMPGLAFTVGASLVAIVALVIHCQQSGVRLVPRIRFTGALNPLMVLGVIACISGIAMAIRAAWAVDVTAVDAILRSIVGTR